MIRVGGTYRFGNEFHRPFAFVVVAEKDDFRHSDSDDEPKRGFVCLVLVGAAVMNALFPSEAVGPGGTFDCGRCSSIAVDSDPYDGSVPV